MPGPFPRFLDPRLREALADTPAVLIHGPRQCGKTTLARQVGEPRGYRYVTFDDDDARAAAEADPGGFVAGLGPRVILDEVQRVPGLFTALKRVIDQRRTPGRFILTGSANVLTVPRLADSLAGRMGILHLHPLSQCELERRPSRFLDRLARRAFRTRTLPRLGPGLAARIIAGGYPAALARKAPARRTAWYRDYIEAQVQRDVRDLSRIRSLDALPSLLTVAAGYTAQLINVSDLAAPFHMTRQTVHDYVTLLERVFLVERLPPWHGNRLSRLVKTPKLHLGDAGLASALLRLDARRLVADRAALGPLLETFVLGELRRQASWEREPPAFAHYRDRDGREVDIVIEDRGGGVSGVEVKGAASVRASDFLGLHALRRAAGKKFVTGIVLHDGELEASFGDGMYAVPIRALWEHPRRRSG